MQSSTLENGAVFELGPRSIRPVGKSGGATLKIVHDLGLEKSILSVPSSHPAARSRFIYSRGKLHELPSGVISIIKKQSLFSKSLLSTILREPFVRGKQDNTDETVYDFFKRRMNEEVAEYLSDPLCRGIFAGDTRVLSLKSCFPPVHQYENQHGSVVKGVLFTREAPDTSIQSPLATRAKKEHWSTWSLQGGMQTLSDKLYEVLKQQGVNFKMNTPCTAVSVNPDGKLTVSWPNEQITVDHVISGIPAQSLASIIPKDWGELASELKNIQSTTVGVVNLEYEGSVIPVEGFGYLVPSSEPLQVLGIIFDSCAFPENDRHGGKTTRITVMMGGHWFNSLFGDTDSVDPGHLQDVAVEAAEKTLGIRAKPTSCLTTIQRDCIPQYTVGHSDRIGNIFDFIDRRKLPLSLIGASYKGVSVNDCIYNAQLTVNRILEQN
ncbi:protoporphyrinogen oxidase-like [Oculina patagonica]